MSGRREESGRRGERGEGVGEDGGEGGDGGGVIVAQGRPEDIDQLIRISNANDGTTICGMGDAAGYATVGIIAKYRDEFEYFIEHKRSRLGGQLEVAGTAHG